MHDSSIEKLAELLRNRGLRVRDIEQFGGNVYFIAEDSLTVSTKRTGGHYQFPTTELKQVIADVRAIKRPNEDNEKAMYSAQMAALDELDKRMR